MAFCKNCGKELADGVQFCANCGTPVAAQPQQAEPVTAQPQQAEPVQQTYQQAPPVQQGYQQAPPVQQVQTAPPTDDVAANRGIAWLAYLGPLFLVPMFARKFSKYCQFHVKQGIALCAACIAYAIATALLLLIIGLIFPGQTYTLYYYTYHVNSGVYNVFSVIFNLGYIFFTVMSIIGIVNAATGKEKKLPLISAIKFFDPLMDKFYGNK